MGKKGTPDHLQKPKWQEVFFQKPTQCSHRNKVLYAASFNKYLTCKKYSFEKLPHFSQENNVLNAPRSTIDAILSRDTSVSSTQQNLNIWNKIILAPL
jgi:hypothetical protein